MEKVYKYGRTVRNEMFELVCLLWPVIVCFAVYWGYRFHWMAGVGLTILFLRTLGSTLGISIYFHRSLAHGSLTLHPALARFFDVVIWLTTGGLRKQWVPVHRKHHAFTDVVGDPHSPRLLGLRNVLLKNAWYYGKAVVAYELSIQDPVSDDRRFALKAPHTFFDEVRFSKRGIYLSGAMYFLLFPTLEVLRGAASPDSWGVLHLGVLAFLGLLLWGLDGVWMPIVGGFVNGLGHAALDRGPNEHCAKNAAKWDLLVLGELHQGNHHADPSRPIFAFRPGEFDGSAPFIYAFYYLGLLKFTSPRQAGYAS